MGGRSVSFGRAVAPEDSQVEESLAGAEEEEGEQNAEATPAFSSAAATTMTERGPLTATHQAMAANDEVLLLLNDTNSDDQGKSHFRRRPGTKRPKWRHSFHTTSTPGLTRTLDEPSLGETMLDGSDRFSADLPFAPPEVFPVQLETPGAARALPGVIDEDAATAWSKENLSDNGGRNAFRRGRGGLDAKRMAAAGASLRVRSLAFLLILVAAFVSYKALSSSLRSEQPLIRDGPPRDVWLWGVGAPRGGEAREEEETRLKSVLSEVDLIVFNWRAASAQLQRELRGLRSATTRVRFAEAQDALSKTLAAMEAREADFSRLRHGWEEDLRLKAVGLAVDREAFAEFLESVEGALRSYNEAASKAVSLQLSQREKMMKLQLPLLRAKPPQQQAPLAAGDSAASAFLSPFLLGKVENYLASLDEASLLARRLRLKTQAPESLRTSLEARLRQWVKEERRPKESVPRSDGAQIHRRASFDADKHANARHQIRRRSKRPLRRTQSAE